MSSDLLVKMRFSEFAYLVILENSIGMLFKLFVHRVVIAIRRRFSDELGQAYLKHSSVKYAANSH